MFPKHFFCHGSVIFTLPLRDPLNTFKPKPKLLCVHHLRMFTRHDASIDSTFYLSTFWWPNKRVATRHIGNTIFNNEKAKISEYSCITHNIQCMHIYVSTRITNKISHKHHLLLLSMCLRKLINIIHYEYQLHFAVYSLLSFFLLLLT